MRLETAFRQVIADNPNVGAAYSNLGVIACAAKIGTTRSRCCESGETRAEDGGHSLNVGLLSTGAAIMPPRLLRSPPLFVTSLIQNSPLLAWTLPIFYGTLRRSGVRT